jgi:hypothetical protein
MTAAGMNAGTITAIQLKCYQAPGRSSLRNFRIRMQHTSATTSTAWVTSGWTPVYGPTNVVPTPGEWYTYNLNTPFVWDGASNLLIDFSRNDGSYKSGGGMYVRTGLTNRTYAGRSDSRYTWPFDNMPGKTYNLAPYIKISYVVEPAFAISVNPTSGNFISGESGTGTATVTITSIDGYAQIVNLSASGQPSGVNISFSPSSGAPSFTSTMTTSVETTVQNGTYPITITGIGADGKVNTGSYTLGVGDFTVSLNPTSGRIGQGTSGTSTVTVTRVGAYAQTVNLSASGQPWGVNISFSPSSGTPTFSSTMMLSVGTTAPLKTYAITITGTGTDGTIRTCEYSLTVLPTVGPL